MRLLTLSMMALFWLTGCPDDKSSSDGNVQQTHLLLVAKCEAGTKAACDELAAKCKDGDQSACSAKAKISEATSNPRHGPMPTSAPVASGSAQ